MASDRAVAGGGVRLRVAREVLEGRAIVPEVLAQELTGILRDALLDGLGDIDLEHPCHPTQLPIRVLHHPVVVDHHTRLVLRLTKIRHHLGEPFEVALLAHAAEEVELAS